MPTVAGEGGGRALSPEYAAHCSVATRVRLTEGVTFLQGVLFTVIAFTTAVAFVGISMLLLLPKGLQ